jgi:hypothetical protein
MFQAIRDYILQVTIAKFLLLYYFLLRGRFDLFQVDMVKLLYIDMFMEFLMNHIHLISPILLLNLLSLRASYFD